MPSDPSSEGQCRVAVRTAASDRRKALEHYQDLRRSGRSARAVVISEDTKGDVTVLGQMLRPEEIGRLLLIATEALIHVDAKRREARLEPHEEPLRRGVHNEAPPREREVKLDAEGVMIPPRGENLVSCGECHHPKFFVFHHNADDSLARYACAHCGNEVKPIPILHPESTGRH